MHGLIFETSIWLLAGSTRLLSWIQKSSLGVLRPIYVLSLERYLILSFYNVSLDWHSEISHSQTLIKVKQLFDHPKIINELPWCSFLQARQTPRLPRWLGLPSYRTFVSIGDRVESGTFNRSLSRDQYKYDSHLCSFGESWSPLSTTS